MSNYVFGTSLSYIDYLQARSFETSFKSELSRQTRSIIASNAELRKHHIEIIEKVSSGVEQLSFDVQALSGEVSELNATFQWGFSELLTSLGRVNDSLAELVKISKTPAQTWAYEQFEIARDAFRQGLFDEALEYLDRAINGYSGNTGYKLEYRFHYLLGTIRMGSFQNTSSDVVNLAESELAFLSAAKYARRDHPEEAGRALLGAGWAAYCQGKMADATRYTDQTLVLIPDLAEGHFQRAKIQMHIDHCDSSLSSLKRAIEIDRGYSIRAAGDDDFKRYDAKVYTLLDAFRQDAKAKAEALLVATQHQAADAEGLHVQEFLLQQHVDLSSAKHALAEASRTACIGTYFGYLDALSFCTQARLAMQNAVAQFLAETDAEVTNRIAGLDSRIASVRNSQSNEWNHVGQFGVVVSLCLGLWQCSHASQAPFGTFLLFTVGGSALAIAGALLGEKTQKARAIEALESEKSRLQEVRSEIQRRTMQSTGTAAHQEHAKASRSRA